VVLAVELELAPHGVGDATLESSDGFLLGLPLTELADVVVPTRVWFA